MGFEEKEKLRKLEQEEKELERKYNYDIKIETEAEQAEKKIKKDKIKTVVATLLLTGGIVFGTHLTGINLPIQNIVGIFVIVSGFTGTMYFSSTKDAREKVAYAQKYNILKEIEYDKVDIEKRNMEIDYLKKNIESLKLEKNETSILVTDKDITLEEIEQKIKPMTRVRN